MPAFLQPTMSGGELSPGLRGRTDLARYQSSLGLARNVIVKPTGGVVKRPGTKFCGVTKWPDGPCRIIPFIYSTEQKYLVEVGPHYMRFWVDGNLIISGSWPATSISAGGVLVAPGHGLVPGDWVVMAGLGNRASSLGSSYRVGSVTTGTVTLLGYDGGAGAGAGGVYRVAELATPYSADMVPQLRYTQSADVMYLAHGRVPLKELRRVTLSQFSLVDFKYRRGPFRGFNTDEAIMMAASSATGVTTLTTNADLFVPGDVGRLVYMEEKELAGIKPWASAEKNVPVGALRRSDSKVYRVASVPTNKGTAGTPFYVTGGQRPVHDVGRAFDGPQDVKNDGVNDYAVGVEWEFLHNTFGIVQITQVNGSRSAVGLVVERLPASVSGAAPAPAKSWTLNGNGASTDFPLPDKTSMTNIDFTVAISGQPVQSNPFYTGGGGVNTGGGGSPRPGNNVPAFDTPER